MEENNQTIRRKNTDQMCITLDKKLIKRVDEVCKARFCERSDYIRECILKDLERLQ